MARGFGVIGFGGFGLPLVLPDNSRKNNADLFCLLQLGFVGGAFIDHRFNPAEIFIDLATMRVKHRNPRARPKHIDVGLRGAQGQRLPHIRRAAARFGLPGLRRLDAARRFKAVENHLAHRQRPLAHIGISRAAIRHKAAARTVVAVHAAIGTVDGNFRKISGEFFTLALLCNADPCLRRFGARVMHDGSIDRFGQRLGLRRIAARKQNQKRAGQGQRISEHKGYAKDRDLRGAGKKP